MPSPTTSMSSALAMSITAWAIAVRLRSDSMPVDERAVDLQSLDREPMQVAERRVAGAEVVEHEPDALVLEVAQRLVQSLGLLEQHALGQLQLQHVGVGAGLSQHLRNHPVKRPVAGLHRRDVDRHRDRRHARSRPAPAGRLTARLEQHPAPDRQDQPVLLGQRDELGRLEQPALGMVPPKQGLDARPRCRRGGSPPAGRKACSSSRASASRRSFSVRSRPSIRACISSSNTSYCPRPRSLARYMAESAPRIRSSASSGQLPGQRDSDARADEVLSELERERLVERG